MSRKCRESRARFLPVNLKNSRVERKSERTRRDTTTLADQADKMKRMEWFRDAISRVICPIKDFCGYEHPVQQRSLASCQMGKLRRVLVENRLDFTP